MTPPREVHLRRALGPLAVTVYAVGDILGAGIYALVGKVVALAGGAAWASFVLSAVVALFTGLTYAELSSRYPVAAGAAAYCRRAFRYPVVAFLVGVFVFASGVTSAATVARAFAGYLDTFVVLPPVPVAVVLLALMSAVNYAGIRESSRINLVLTAVEFSGLLLVVVAGARAFGTGSVAASAAPTMPLDAAGVLSGATIAFYAYIGFEDTVNVAEEIRDPARVLPRAILTAIAISCALYLAVTVAALVSVPHATLAASGAPLLEVLKAAGMEPPAGVFPIVALFAISNTGLLNLIMASRLSYGMAREGLLPAALGWIHPRRQTPWAAILLAFVLAAALAVSGGAQILAQTTSLLLLCVFTLLHVGLLLIKRRVPHPVAGAFVTPAWTPVVGLLLCVVMIAQYSLAAYLRAAAVLGVGVCLYAGSRWAASARVGDTPDNGGRNP